MRLSALLFCLLALVGVPQWADAARAACGGEDLLATMPEAELRLLRARSDAAPHARGNLWRAERDGQVIHLVGTYHFDDARHDARMERLVPILDRARLLLVEAGPQEEAQLAEALLARPEFMYITEGPTLPELLPEAEWQALAEAMRDRGVPGFLAAKFRPWYVSMLLNLSPCALAEMRDGARGLDHRIMAVAAGQGLEVAALEPFDTLFRLFEGLSEDDEIGMIRSTLLVADRADDMTHTLANAYFAGENRLIWEFTLAEALKVPGFAPAEVEAQFALMENVLMTARNRAWIPVLTAAAREHGEVVAAFGALHLPGAEGVLALLEVEGFTIEAQAF